MQLNRSNAQRWRTQRSSRSQSRFWDLSNFRRQRKQSKQRGSVKRGNFFLECEYVVMATSRIDYRDNVRLQESVRLQDSASSAIQVKKQVVEQINKPELAEVGEC